MKNYLFLIISSCLLLGCSINQTPDEVSKNKLESYVYNIMDTTTPKDNFYNLQVICFKDVSGNLKYKESFNLSISKEIGEPIEYMNENEVDSIAKSNHDRPDGYIINPNSFGLALNYSMEEDINGEYVGYINFFKQELISIRKNNYSFIPVISSSSVNHDYHPINKKPYKFFESDNKSEICYLIVKW